MKWVTRNLFHGGQYEYRYSHICRQASPSGGMGSHNLELFARFYPANSSHLYQPDHRPQHDVAIVRTRVIALQVDRAGAELIGPQGAARATEQRLVVDDFFAVEHHRDVAIHKRDVEGLPLAGGLFLVIFERLLGRSISTKPN